MFDGFITLTMAGMVSYPMLVCMGRCVERYIRIGSGVVTVHSHTVSKQCIIKIDLRVRITIRATSGCRIIYLVLRICDQVHVTGMHAHFVTAS